MSDVPASARAVSAAWSAPWSWPRRTLGPLGRYRPSLFRMDMTEGFEVCDRSRWPRWRWLPRWASAEEKLLAALDLRGKAIYDVGAFTGAYSLFFSRRAGVAGTVVAFEPQPDAYAKLARNLGLNHVTNVYPLSMALGAGRGTRVLRALPGMATTASLAPDADTPLRVHAGEARMETLDALLRHLPLPAPDFIKIDVEGMELEVVEGAATTLARFHPELLIEIHGAGRARKAARVLDLARLLVPLAYTLTHIESGRQVTTGDNGIASGHLHARIVKG